MSRVIKFRAWDKNNKKMLVLGGGVGAGNIIDTFLQRLNPIGKPTWQLGAGDWDWIVVGADSDKGDSLMQFTGYKDLHGTDIYEGDLLHEPIPDEPEFDTPTDALPVMFEHGAFWYNGSLLYDYADGDTDRLIELEVVGNIYEGLQ